MSELFTNMWFLLFAWLTITSVVSTIAYYWHKVRQAELDASLKQQMVERGMSAAEIQVVIQASGGKRRGKVKDAEPVSEEKAPAA